MNQLFEIIRANKINVLLAYYAKERGAITLRISATCDHGNRWEAVRSSDQYMEELGFPGL